MHKIEKELLKATKIDPRGDDETVADYLERVVAAVNVLDDEGWEALSPAAQAWQNAAAEAIKAGTEIADFGDTGKPTKGGKAEAKPTKAPAKPAGKAAKVKAPEPEEDEEPEEEEADEDEAEVAAAPRKGAGKKAQASSNGKDDEGDAKPAKPRRARELGKTGMSAVMFARHHLATHPGCTVEDMADAIKKAGYQTPLSNMTLNSLRNDFRAWGRIFGELSYLKRGVELGL